MDAGVKQGCIVSPLSFGIAIDWIVKKCISNTNTGIARVGGKCLEDLDAAAAAE